MRVSWAARLAVASALTLFAGGLAVAKEPCWPKGFVTDFNGDIGWFILAPSSSSTWSSAASSNTSGCGGGTRAALRHFLRDADAPLAAELARGRGDHVNALAALLGCDAAAAPAFGRAAQAAYPRLAAAGEDVEALGLALEGLLRTEASLAGRCTGVARG